MSQRIRSEIKADIQHAFDEQDRYNRRSVNKGGPMQQEAHYRRFTDRINALHDEQDSLPPCQHLNVREVSDDDFKCQDCGRVFED